MNIAIWGAGKFGTFVAEQLEKSNKINCFIDKDAEKINKVLGKIVVSPEMYLKEYEVDTDIVLVAITDAFSMIEKMNDMNVKKIGIIHEKVYRYHLELSDDIFREQNIIWDEEWKKKKTAIRTLETNVVDFCNLNCKGCSHFSNTFARDEKVGYESFERDIIQLSKNIHIGQFNLLGGEVFLAEDLDKYIKCLKKHMPKTHIEIISNGLLIPRQSEDLLKIIQQNAVTISITEYPPVSKMKEQISSILTKYNIIYEFRGKVETFGKNINLSGNCNPFVAQQNCRERKCQFLRNGKIYKCPFSALGNHFFQYYNMPLLKDEGIDIYDANLEWKETMQALRKEPIDLCCYCGQEERFPWKRSDMPKKEEWIL